MARLLAALSVAFVVTAVAAAPVPKHLMKEPVYYHPTQPGAKRIYVLRTPERPEGEEIEEVVMAVEDWKGTKLVSVGTVSDGKPRSAGWAVSVSGRGLVEGRMTREGFAPVTELLRLPAEPDTRWEVTVGKGRGGVTHQYSTPGEEDIEVPAGKFKAVRVDTVFLFNEGGEEKWRQWYASGVAFNYPQLAPSTRIRGGYR